MKKKKLEHTTDGLHFYIDGKIVNKDKYDQEELWQLEQVKLIHQAKQDERERIQNIIKEMPDTFPELESDDYDEAYQDAKQYILNKLS